MLLQQAWIAGAILIVSLKLQQKTYSILRSEAVRTLMTLISLIAYSPLIATPTMSCTTLFFESLDGSFDDSETTSTVPLYSGSSLSVLQAAVLIFQFVVKHSLSNKVFTELLQLLLVLLPAPAALPKSVYLFKKYFSQQFPRLSTVVTHYSCSLCQKLLETPNKVCCGQCKPSKFVTVPLGPQLKRLCEGITLL